jgi:hypothetical protein
LILEDIAENEQSQEISFKRSNSISSYANTPSADKMNSIVERAKLGLSKRKQVKQRSSDSKKAIEYTYDEINNLIDKDYMDLITSLDEKRRNIKNYFKNLMAPNENHLMALI